MVWPRPFRAPATRSLTRMTTPRPGRGLPGSFRAPRRVGILPAKLRRRPVGDPSGRRARAGAERTQWGIGAGGATLRPRAGEDRFRPAALGPRARDGAEGDGDQPRDEDE